MEMATGEGLLFIAPTATAVAPLVGCLVAGSGAGELEDSERSGSCERTLEEVLGQLLRSSLWAKLSPCSVRENLKGTAYRLGSGSISKMVIRTFCVL